MLETLLVTFREGLEAFLIIAIMIAYLSKTGRDHLIKPVYMGVLVAVVISATTGWHVAKLAQDPIWEGVLSIIAGAMVASFTIYIMRTAKNIRQNIGNTLEKHARAENIWAKFGVFGFTILMVAREGMETALMLGAISAQNNASSMWIGAAAGFIAVGIIAYLWKTQSQRINLRLFLQVTGIFLLLFSIHLFTYGIHELSGMNALPLIGDSANANVYAWSSFIESGWFMNLVTFGLMAVPCGWLLGSYIQDKRRGNSSHAAAE